jgi:hypothetical protein
MRKSDELYHKDIRAKRTFNRLLREKNRISDILFEMNESEHLRSDLKVSANGPEQFGHQSKVELPEFAKHYIDLIDEAYDFSSDEEQQQLNRNPMEIEEWIHNNCEEDYLYYLEDISGGGSAHSRNNKRKEIEKYRSSDTEDENPRKKRAE